MKLKSLFKDNKLKIAGLIIIIGLAIKICTIFFIHPVTFLIDMGISTLLIAAGIVFIDYFENRMWLYVYCSIPTALLILICWKKGEKAKWRRQTKNDRHLVCF